jgi:hypothetical protein
MQCQAAMPVRGPAAPATIIGACDDRGSDETTDLSEALKLVPNERADAGDGRDQARPYGNDELRVSNAVFMAQSVVFDRT